MADYTITPSLVKPSAQGLRKLKRVIAGETITQGQPVYLDAVSGKYKLADANDATVLTEVAGIAVVGASLDQPLLYVTEDPDFDLGVTVGSGEVVVLSQNVGKLCPDADVVNGKKIVLGVGKGGTKIGLMCTALLRGGAV